MQTTLCCFEDLHRRFSKIETEEIHFECQVAEAKPWLFGPLVARSLPEIILGRREERGIEQDLSWGLNPNEYKV